MFILLELKLFLSWIWEKKEIDNQEEGEGSIPQVKRRVKLTIHLF